ncbi:MAG: glycosyltransferase family 4 protein [Chlorobium sp.]|uniref:glycosyltransferase family 4 protein n=1 Tax=Chlorobium sp. TaxID=1095 RepID=UPI0025BD280D|nr:glycosyltransferase family 4 protein [Chlorobium sp.]MCF8383429.1 glycosyltransferase family 4 protein [Chlorobium sp.]
MNVLIAIPCLLRGGTEMQTLYLVKALVKAGHNVEIICYFEFDMKVVEEFGGSEGRVILLNLDRSSGFLRIIGELRKCFAGRRPDAVHVQYMAPGALAIIAARLAGIRIVLATVHQPYTVSHGPHAKMILRVAAKLCDSFISVSRNVEQSWFGNSCGDPLHDSEHFLKHCTLYNAVDAARVIELSGSPTDDILAIREKNGSMFIFGYLGRVRHEKGLDILFEAFAQLSKKYNNTRLLIVGDGPDLPVLKETYGHESWWPYVLFAGEMPWENAMRYFFAVDAVVVPSRFEGFGLSAVEAMAASKPVIASRAGGLSEIITHGLDGLLFQNGSNKELSAMMEVLLLDPVKRAELSRNAHQRASDFDVVHFDRKIRNLYKSEA